MPETTTFRFTEPDHQNIASIKRSTGIQRTTEVLRLALHRTANQEPDKALLEETLRIQNEALEQWNPSDFHQARAKASALDAFARYQASRAE